MREHKTDSVRLRLIWFLVLESTVKRVQVGLQLPAGRTEESAWSDYSNSPAGARVRQGEKS